MTSRRIVFWRHGRTAWNAERRFQGQMDIPLDAAGAEQAALAARTLALLNPDRIISSDLSRARATAQALADLTGLEVAEDAGLRETFAGEWQGLTRSELETRFGDELVRWTTGPDVRPGGGETRREVAERMVAAVNRGLAGLEDGQTLVVATHGGSARAAMGSLLALPADCWAALGVLVNCAWSVLEEGRGVAAHAWRLQEYNAGSLPVTALADDR